MSDTKTKSATPAERKERFTTLAGLPVDRLYTEENLASWTPNPLSAIRANSLLPAALLLCLYVAVARAQAPSLKKLSGTVQNALLKEYIARGPYIYPVRPAMRIVTDIFSWCPPHLPKWNPLPISGYHIREAGSTA